MSTITRAGVGVHMGQLSAKDTASLINQLSPYGVTGSLAGNSHAVVLEDMTVDIMVRLVVYVQTNLLCSVIDLALYCWILHH